MSIAKDNLLAALAQVDEEIEALVSGLAPGDLERLIYPQWTLHQVLAHLASFDYARLGRRWLRQAKGEVAPPGGSFDSEAWNQREVAAREGRPLEEILAELRAHRQGLTEMVSGLSPADLDVRIATATGMMGSLSGILGEMAVEHEQQHLAEINGVLGR